MDVMDAMFVAMDAAMVVTMFVAMDAAMFVTMSVAMFVETFLLLTHVTLALCTGLAPVLHQSIWRH